MSRPVSFDRLWAFDCSGSVISVAATPHCRLVAATDVARRVTLLSDDGKELWHRPLDHEGWAVRIASNGCRIAVGTASKNPARGSLYVFDRDGGQRFCCALPAPVWSVDLSWNGDTIVVNTWGNEIYLFTARQGSYELAVRRSIGRCGLYGVSLLRDGSAAVVAAYDDAVYIVDRDLETLRRVECGTGLYNVACDHAGNAIVGCRDGTFVFIPVRPEVEPIVSRPVSERPLCGVATTARSDLVAVGSFDGRLSLTSRTGEPLWTVGTTGEVWSTAMSDDGTIVVAGSADHKVYYFRNHCTPGVLDELTLLRQAMRDGHDTSAAVRDFTRLCLAHGLVDYGAAALRESLNPQDATRSTEALLRADVEGGRSTERSSLLLANQLQGSGRWADAIGFYQQAADEPELRLQALTGAGDCFARLGHETAARSCFRRAREAHLTDKELLVLFMLAQSYEEHGAWDEARRVYELIVSWQKTYRNAWERLSRIPSAAIVGRNGDSASATLPVTLQGPDVPRAHEVADMLMPVLQARGREVAIEPEAQRWLAVAIEAWTRTHRERGDAYDRLSYDRHAYARYDCLPPEDEMKKELEMVQLLTFVSAHPSIARAIDIGAATGRHPTQLATLGIKAIGIDIELDAIAVARARHAANGRSAEPHGAAGWPKYVQTAAQAMGIRGASFDLVTCMMGTFAHIPRGEHRRVCEEMHRLLVPGGWVAVSTWDIECRHQSYLSMYSEQQKERIRRHSLTQCELVALFRAVGFRAIAVKPFVLVPNVTTYDLGCRELKARDLSRLLELDLAAATLFPSTHGEMFMLVAQR